ncbi:MAG: zf-HC2 domain-containing protein [Actinobacteria bacterium]|nr:zf-HC2 domain-containing protein [Actinomycetota bacterium]
MSTPAWPPSSCQWARQAISAQLDDELSEIGTARLRHHLRTCAECSAYAQEAAAVTTRMRMAPLVLPDARIASPRPRRRRRAPVTAAAAVLVVSGGLLALSNVWGRPGSSKPEAAATVQVLAGLRAGGSDGLFVPTAFPQAAPRIREIAL